MTYCRNWCDDPDPDQPLRLNYLGLVPVSKAIQEQQAQIEGFLV